MSALSVPTAEEVHAAQLVPRPPTPVLVVVVTDRRRRRWVPIDVDLLTGDDGRALIDRWGPMGVVAWLGFLTACAKSSHPGVLRWRSETEARVLMGIDGMPLVDADGRPFTLGQFFRWTGHRRWTTTRVSRRAGGVTQTRARRWDDWQPRKHRAVANVQSPQVSAGEKGSERADEGLEWGANGAPKGLPTHTHTHTSPTSIGEVGEESSPARAPEAARRARSPRRTPPPPTPPVGVRHRTDVTPDLLTLVRRYDPAAVLDDSGITLASGHVLPNRSRVIEWLTAWEQATSSA